MLYDLYNVSEVLLKPKDSVELKLRLEPGAEVEEGVYTFHLYAFSEDVKSNEVTIKVNLLKSGEEVLLKAGKSVVTGTPGSTFSFRFNIENKGYRDLTFALSATIPKGWYSLGFKPSPYETTAISEVTVKAKSTKWGVVFEAWCPEDTKPGMYPVIVTITGDGIEKSLEFKAEVSGTYKLSLETEGELLSFRVRAGGRKEITLVVRNEGTGDMKNVKIFCDTPAGWKATLSQDRIELLPAKRSVKISLAISPPAGAIAGDYMVTVRAWGAESSDKIDLRITVTKPTFWGIVGLVVIAASVLILLLAFMRYGRP